MPSVKLSRAQLIETFKCLYQEKTIEELTALGRDRIARPKIIGLMADKQEYDFFDFIALAVKFTGSTDECIQDYLDEVKRIYQLSEQVSSGSSYLEENPSTARYLAAMSKCEKFFLSALVAADSPESCRIDLDYLSSRATDAHHARLYSRRFAHKRYDAFLSEIDDFNNEVRSLTNYKSLIPELNKLAGEIVCDQNDAVVTEDFNIDASFKHFVCDKTLLDVSSAKNTTMYIDKIRDIYSKIKDKTLQNFYLTVIYVEQSFDDEKWYPEDFDDMLRKYPFIKDFGVKNGKGFFKLMEEFSYKKVIPHVEPLKCDTLVGHGNGLKYNEVYVNDLLGFLDASKGELNSTRFIASPAKEKSILLKKVDVLERALQKYPKDSVHLRIDKHVLNRRLYKKVTPQVVAIDYDELRTYKDDPSKELRGELKAIARELDQLRKHAPITGAENDFLLSYFNQPDLVEIFGTDSRWFGLGLSDYAKSLGSKKRLDAHVKMHIEQRFARAAVAAASVAAASAAGASAASSAPVDAEPASPAVVGAHYESAGGGDSVKERSADKKVLGDFEINKIFLQKASEKLDSIHSGCFSLFQCGARRKKTNLHKEIESLKVALQNHIATPEDLGGRLEAIVSDLNKLSRGAGDELFRDHFCGVTKVDDMGGKLSACMGSTTNPISNGAEQGAGDVHTDVTETPAAATASV